MVEKERGVRMRLFFMKVGVERVERGFGRICNEMGCGEVFFV